MYINCWYAHYRTTETMNNSESEVVSTSPKKTNMQKTKLPSRVILELTYQCHHKCIFCSSPWNNCDGLYPIREILNWQKWVEIVDRLVAQGIDHITLSGGEPLCYDGLWDLVSFISSKHNHINISIITSAPKSENKNSFIEKCVRYGIKNISISLPGISTFNSHTATDETINSPSNVLNWIRSASEKGIHVTTNIPVSQHNYAELYRIVAMAAIAGTNSFLITRFVPGGRGLKNSPNLYLTHSQLNEMLDLLEVLCFCTNISVAMGTEIPLCLIDDVKKYSHVSINSACGAANKFFVIDPSGYVRVCNHSPHIVGDINNPKIITDTSYWENFANQNYLPNECVECNQKGLCTCGCREAAHIVHGNIRAVDTSILNDSTNKSNMMMTEEEKYVLKLLLSAFKKERKPSKLSTSSPHMCYLPNFVDSFDEISDDEI